MFYVKIPDNLELKNHTNLFTKGKLYKAQYDAPNMFRIIHDENREIVIRTDVCAFIGTAWEVYIKIPSTSILPDLLHSLKLPEK